MGGSAFVVVFNPYVWTAITSDRTELNRWHWIVTLLTIRAAI
jgi:hypothetical protein